MLTGVSHLVDTGIYADVTARNYLNALAAKRIVEKRVISGKHYYLNLELYTILGD